MFDAFEHISGSHCAVTTWTSTLAALTVARSCNVGLTPVVKAGMRRAHRAPADRGGEGLLPRRGHRGGLGAPGRQAGRDRHHRGLGRRAGRLRRRGAVRGAGPVPVLPALPLYFGVGKRPKGATWLNTVSDKVMGLGGLVVPGTLRDSLFILDAIHRLDATEQAGDRHHRHRVATPTSCTACSRSAATSSRPAHRRHHRHPAVVDRHRHAGRRLTGHTGANGWGDFNTLGLRRVSLPAIASTGTTWCGSPGRWRTGQVRAYDLIRMMTADGRPPAWATPSPTTAGSSRRCTCCRSSTWRSTGG